MGSSLIMRKDAGARGGGHSGNRHSSAATNGEHGSDEVWVKHLIPSTA